MFKKTVIWTDFIYAPEMRRFERKICYKMYIVVDRHTYQHRGWNSYYFLFKCTKTTSTL